MSKSPPPKKQRLNDTYEDDKTVVAMETERRHSTDITTKPLDEKKGEKNLKSFLHGITYQQKLLLITFLCGASSENEFSLITEDEKAGKFDDIVYTEYDNNHPMITFIQAKHSQDETKKITFKNLTSKVSNDKFSLGKYFLSYLTIKNSYGISSIEKVILCSNIDLSKECLKEQEIQINHVKETIFKNKSFLLYQLIQEKDNNQEPNDCPKALINHLTNSSQLSQLADYLVNLCMKSKTLKLNNYLFKRYHIALFSDNILINASAEGKTATFCSGFLDGSRKGETFYEMFKKNYEKDGKRNLVDLQNNGITFEKTINFGVNFLLAPFQLNENECDTFVDEIISLMNQNEETPLYRKPPKAKNWGFMGKLAGRVIFCTNVKDVYKFGTCIFKEDLQNSRGEDRSNNIEIQKLRNAFIKKLKYCNKSLNDLMKFKMRLNNYYTCSEELIPYQSLIDEKNDVEDIQEFLKRLYFLKTPTDDDLVKVLNTELKTKILTQPYFNVDFSRAFMSEIILNWMKEKLGRPLNKQEAMDAIKEMNQKIAILKFAGNNFRYCQKLKNYNILFSNTAESTEIKEKLKSFIQNPNKRTCLFDTDYYLFGALRMLQLLDNKEIDSFVFDKAKHLSQNIANVQLIFHSKTGVDLAIVVCKNGENFDFEDLIKNAGKNKKVIIVAKNNETSDYDKIIYDNTNIKHFSRDTQNKILKKKIIFQGNPNISLSELLENNLGILDNDTLLTIIKNKKNLEIGKSPEKLPSDVNECYIERNLSQNIVFDSEILKKASLTNQFVIETEYPFPEKNDFVSYTTSITNISESVYKQNTHFFKRKVDKLVWQKSVGFVNDLVEHKRNGIYVLEDLIFANDRFVVISNVAGMGKSTILTSLIAKYKKCNPTQWVIRINVRKYRKQFDKQTSSAKIFNEMLENELTSDFTRTLYKKRCSQRKVLIIFDGYDEIDPEHRIKLNDILKNSKAKIWVTTRTYLQRELEKLFNVFSLSIEPLSEFEQIHFLLKFWKINYKKNMTEKNEERLKKYAETVVEKFCQNISDDKNLFGSIPLQLKMLAEYFHGYKEAHDDWEKCYDFIENEKNEEPILPEALDLYCLYKTFLHKKITEIYVKEKNDIYSKDAATPLIKNKKRIHEKLALKRFLKTDSLRTIFTEDEFTKMQETISSESVGTVGIITDLENDEIDFVHLTFAEYFASVALVKMLLFNNLKSKKKDIFKIIDNMIPTMSNVFVTCIASKFRKNVKESKELLNGKSLAAYAVIKNFRHLFEALVENGLENFSPNDTDNKTPLHYAAEKGNLEAVEFLLAYHNNLMETEILKHGKFKRPEYEFSKLVMYTNLKDVYGKTALCYSVEKTKEMAIMCKLLLNGANIIFLKDSLNEIVLYLTHETHCLYDSDHENRPLVELLLLQAPNAVKDLDTRYSFPRLLSYLFLHGRLEVIMRIIDCLDAQKKLEVLNNDYNGVTPLDRVNNSKYLTDRERLEITQYLMENDGKAVKQKNYFNSDCSSITNILQGAARSGHLQTLKTFMLKEEKEKRGMHFSAACDYKQYNVIKFFLENCSREDLYFEGNGPLHAAVDSGFDKRFINKEILARGYNFNEQNEKGETPLFMAMFRNDSSQIINLVQQGADINVKTNEGQTPLDFAIKYEQYNVVKYFLLNCNIEKTTPYLNVMYDYYKNPTYDLNGNQNSLLERAIYENDEFLCRFIIKHGKNINIKTKNNKFCLHVAIANKREDIAKLILQYGGIYEADIPLNETIQNSSNSCVSQLLKLLFKISETTKILVKPTLEDSEKDSLVYI